MLPSSAITRALLFGLLDGLLVSFLTSVSVVTLLFWKALTGSPVTTRASWQQKRVQQGKKREFHTLAAAQVRTVSCSARCDWLLTRFYSNLFQRRSRTSVGFFSPRARRLGVERFSGKSLIEFRSGVHQRDRDVPIGSEETRGFEEKP